ncbi:ATP-binding cassette domain-containing protein [Flammeovirga yaeyamensis]|uniref:ATP-binding cassette domain-containing protein n=1 Tax=Flammeovirga yaeyamensis TaxID=367791 RepID=A0AAX1N0I6_9BACT|nr:ABC transporter transmembrane domain-containing protein [Flammeovirga yaeyamensis]MBB3698626.1 ABC transporter fused permease/ATP-binding protein [Flammeovirga yaeyamensis]NMF34026.1 ATP-binding cassette domain-containing protein [Flammeovirga yaeyamensis]QWG01014.1 ATP-binding cassette domain-containing protein [Flammeovirga yaeyamensis]
MSRKDTGEKKAARLDKKGIKKLRSIFRFMLPYKGTFTVGIISLFFSSTVLLALPRLTGELLDTALGNSTIPYLENLTQVGLALMAVLVLQSIFSFARVYFFAIVNENAMADLRRALYEKFMSLPMSFYDKNRSGELFSRITSDVAVLQDTFSTTLAELFRQVATLVLGIIILFTLNFKLTMFMMLTFPILIIAAIIFGKFIRKLSKGTQDALADTNIIVEETLQSIATVKTFANEHFEVTRYANNLFNVIKIALKAATYKGAFISFIITVLMGGIIGVLWYGTYMVSTEEITVGNLISFVLYTMFIGGSIGGLGDIYGNIQKAVGATDRVEEILNAESEHQIDKENVPRLQGNISFKNVIFSYPTRKEIEVLKGVDLEINQGERVALVGKSGGGKSTIAQLLQRFYAIDSGDILIDGKSTQDYNLIGYRKHVGVVPQEVLLFGGSIEENIKYGNPEASKEEVIDAARKANALEFIESFPEGFDTLVGERGVKLSGGQRQRIAIARAILKDPAILILDEATSALDIESEKLVQDALETLMEGRTSLIIAHRLSTIRNADKIAVLESGKIKEIGKHDELMQNESGAYNKLIQLQEF